MRAQASFAARAGAALVVVLFACAATAGAAGEDGYAIALWAAPTPPSATAAAVYGEIGGGGTQDRLIGLSTVVAQTAALHQTDMSGGVMRMAPVEGLDLPVGGALVFETGANHIMLMGLKAPLRDGDSFTIELMFVQAGAIEAEVTVREPD